MTTPLKDWQRRNAEIEAQKRAAYIAWCKVQRTFAPHPHAK